MSADPAEKTAVRERLLTLAERAQRWMLDESFEFWADRSPSSAGGFFEKLDLAGKGIPGQPSRVRLQARMGFTFALAAEMGWDRERAEALAERSIATLVQYCKRADGLYGKSAQPGVGLIDDTADTYDTAFALLAFATVYRVFRMPQAFEAGKDLSRRIDELLSRPPAEGGYKEGLPAPTIRDQNPHMHLTEASLAWFEATRDERALKRAVAISDFIHQRFFRSDLGLLVERAGVPDYENRTEAGHMFEWVWILGRLRDLGGPAPRDFSRALHEGGIKLIEGLDYLPLSQQLDGSVIEAVQRTWGPTEKLKGHIAYWRLEPTEGLLETVVQTAEGLFADHIDQAVKGAWIDVISPDREPRIEDITPATGYHVFLALQELMTLVADLNNPGNLRAEF